MFTPSAFQFKDYTKGLGENPYSDIYRNIKLMQDSLEEIIKRARKLGVNELDNNNNDTSNNYECNITDNIVEYDAIIEQQGYYEENTFLYNANNNKEEEYFTENEDNYSSLNNYNHNNEHVTFLNNDNNSTNNTIYNNYKGDSETEDEAMYQDNKKRNRYQYNNYDDYNTTSRRSYFCDNSFRRTNYKKQRTTITIKYDTNYYNNDYNDNNDYNNNNTSYKFTQQQFNFSLGSTSEQIKESLTNIRNKLIGNIIPNNFNEKRKSIYVENNRYQNRLHVECSYLCKRIRSLRSFEKKVENALRMKTVDESKRDYLYRRILKKLDFEREERDLLKDRLINPDDAYLAGFRTWRGKKIFQFDSYTLEGQYDARDLDFYDVRGLAGLQIVGTNDKVMFFSQKVLGLFIPIKNIHNEIVAAQIKPFTNNPRYITLSSKRSHYVTIHNRYEEIPLAFWECKEHYIKDALFVTEGILKSFITGLRTKSHCLGGICSDFMASETTLHYYLQEFKKKYSYVKQAFICPDAGMIWNENITANYIELSIVLEHYFSEVYFLWWDQVDKDNDKDIDELDDEDLFKWKYLTREEYVCKHPKKLIQTSKFLRFYRDELKRKKMYSTILQKCWQPPNNNNHCNDDGYCW